MKNVGAAALIVDDDGRVLLVKHTYGALNWELPGGGGEPNESPVDTIIREVKEETGLTVIALSMTGCYYTVENEMFHFVFRCEPVDASETPVPDKGEISACAFWSPESLPRPISDWTVRRIQDALAGNQLPLPLSIGPRIWL